MGKRSKIAAIDLFCGTGGLSLGLKQGGIRVVAGIDNASACSYPYSHNIKAKFIERSVCDVTGEDLKRMFVSWPAVRPVSLFPRSDVARTHPMRKAGRC